MSTSWSSDLQNSKQISLLFTNSLMKRNLVSMCLVLLWNTWFFDNAMAELLSQKIVAGSWWFCDKSFNTLLIQTAWHVRCPFGLRGEYWIILQDYIVNTVSIIKTLLIQTTWHAALAAATYSASVEDKVTMGCFFEAHETTPVPKWNVYPYVLFLPYMLPPLSLSMYPMSCKTF